jgi:hypothetical protein
VVPTEQGTLTLPDINVTYWDTETRTISTASASTKGIEIESLPSTSSKANDTTTNKQTIGEPLPAQTRSVAPISLAKKPIEKTTPPTQTTPENGLDLEVLQSEDGLSLRHYLIAGLLLLAASMLSIWAALWFKRKKAQPDISYQVPTLQEFAPLSTSDEQSAYKALIECCQQNNLHSLRPNLLEWARHRWGDNEIRSVDDIKRLTSVQVTQLLMEAELMLYSNNPAHEWQGEPLADALEEYTSGQAKPSQASQLKTLYPNF